MHIVLGGTGNVGSNVAKELKQQGEAVLVVTSDSRKVPELQAKGYQASVADVSDTKALHKIFQQGKRLFLLNPPAPVTTDIDTVERNNIQSIVTALEGSGLEKIVAASTYGAQASESASDLGSLYELEQKLTRQSIQYCVNRGAYYYSNWFPSLKTARETGVIYTLFPVSLPFAMVSPTDLGRAGARRMMTPLSDTGTYHVEGPERYTVEQVAAAFSNALNKPVKAETVPRTNWREYFKSAGFSDAAAESFVKMTELALNSSFPDLSKVEQGTEMLENYIFNWVASS